MMALEAHTLLRLGQLAREVQSHGARQPEFLAALQVAFLRILESTEEGTASAALHAGAEFHHKFYVLPEEV